MQLSRNNCASLWQVMIPVPHVFPSEELASKAGGEQDRKQAQSDLLGPHMTEQEQHRVRSPCSSLYIKHCVMFIANTVLGGLLL